MIKRKAAAVFALASLPCCAFSGVFTGDITIIDPTTARINKSTFNLDSTERFFDQVSTNSFKQLFPDYSQTSVVSAKTFYQGVAMDISIPSNSNAITLSIPEIGLNRVFEGSSRANSSKQLERYLRDDNDDVRSDLEKWQGANTPNSPLFGNNTSLANQLFGSTFNTAANSNTTNSNNDTRPASNSPILIGVGGGEYTQTASNGKATNISVLSVPISYGLSISDDPRKKLLINGQFNNVAVGQAETFSGSLGLGYQHPLQDNWQLIPSLSYGLVGSYDLATTGQIISTAISSKYQFKLGDYPSAVVNMLAYYKTLPLSLSNAGVASDPNIDNIVFKNGIFPTTILPFKAFGHNLKMKGIFTDTEIFGSSVFLRQYNEIGFEIASIDKSAWLDKVTFGMMDSLSLSAKYIFSIENSSRIQGYDIGMSYNF